MALTFYAGQTLRASSLIKLIPQQVVRNVDFPVVNNTVLFDDSVLFFTNLQASATYRLFADVWWKASTTGDFRLGWSCSGTSSTLSWSPGGFDNTFTASNSADSHGGLALTDGFTFGGVSPTTFPQVARPQGTLFTGTGTGITFKLRWCQGTADAINASSILAGSQVTLIQIP